MSRQRYRIQPVFSNAAFHFATVNNRFSGDPEYIKANIRSYIEMKQVRGKTKGEISHKLVVLERELPQFGDQFRAVRVEFGLPYSPFLDRQASLAQNQRQLERYVTVNGPGLGRTQSNPSGPREWSHYNTLAPSPSTSTVRLPRQEGYGLPNTSPRRPSTITRPSAPATTSTVRRQLNGEEPIPEALRNPIPAPRNPEDSDEPPPPPYANNDPDPESTRLLQVRLAAEAEASGRIAPELSTPVAATASPRRPRASFSTSTGRPTPPRSAVASPAVEATVPSRPPSDEDLRRVWEDSQLEEAKRASRQAERERLEMDEAVRLSLAEADNQPGPSTSTRVGSQLQGDFGNSSEQFFNENQPGSDPASRRVSSYESNNPLDPVPHRRAISDVTGPSRSYPDQYIQDMDNLTIPDAWQAHGTTQAITETGTGAGYGQQLSGSLLDQEDGNEGFGQAPIVPQKTGAVLQSKNPFLSPQDASAGPSEPVATSSSSTMGPPRMPSQSDLRVNTNTTTSTPGTPQRKTSNQSLRESPGSSFTRYLSPIQTLSGKQLPSIPDANSPTVYAPPPGPPPGHVSAAGQNQQSKPDLPPRKPTEDQPPSTPSQRKLPYPPSSAQAPNPNIAAAPQLPQRLPSTQYFSTTQPPPSPSVALQRAISTSHGGEDPLEMLRSYDTVFLVDDSSSMAGGRWDQARNALMGTAEIAAQYSDEGVDVYFLNSKRVGKGLKAAEDVEDLFGGLVPRGTTPTGAKMELILRDYMTRLERAQVLSPSVDGIPHDAVKPMNLIVVTDGVFAHPVFVRKQLLARNTTINRLRLLSTAPADDPESVIIAVAKRLDKGEFPLSQIGIQFLQIGDDSEAREALQELDDGLSEAHGVRDMVDTVLFEGDDLTAGLIVKALLGGINRRLDRRRTG